MKIGIILGVLLCILFGWPSGIFRDSDLRVGHVVINEILALVLTTLVIVSSLRKNCQVPRVRIAQTLRGCCHADAMAERIMREMRFLNSPSNQPMSNRQPSIVNRQSQGWHPICYIEEACRENVEQLSIVTF